MNLKINLTNLYSYINDPIPQDIFNFLKNKLNYSLNENRVLYLIHGKPEKAYFLTGLYSFIKYYLSEAGYILEVNDMRKHTGYEVNYKWNPERVLRYYQKEAVNVAVRATRGVLNLGTGSGKTTIAANIIASLKRNAFVIVNTTLALKDTYQDFLKCFPYNNVKCYGDGNKDIGDITICTIQSLLKMNSKLEEAFKNTDIIIWDEVHNTIGPGKYRKIPTLTDAFYRFGLTATAYRNIQNQELLMFGYTGRIIYQKHATDLQSENFLAKSKVYFVNFEHKYSYEDYLESIVKNEERNNLITELALHFSKNYITAISVLLKEHGEILSEKTGFVFLHGSLEKEKKEAIRNLLKTGKLKGVIATKILTASADFPMLKVFINATAEKSRVSIIQKKGRILRKFLDLNAFQIDIYDKYSSKYENNSKMRIEFFKKEGWDSEILSKEEILCKKLEEN